MKPRKIQFAFYTKGYGKDGTVKALVLFGRVRLVVHQVRCFVSSFTTFRKNNPVFVVQCKGVLRLVGDKNYLSAIITES